MVKRHIRYIVVLHGLALTLKDKIDEWIIRLRRQNDQSQPEQAQANREFAPRKLPGPIPGIFSKPDSRSRHQEAEKVIRLEQNTAQKGGVVRGVSAAEHACQIDPGLVKVAGAEEHPGQRYDQKGQRGLDC